MRAAVFLRSRAAFSLFARYQTELPQVPASMLRKAQMDADGKDNEVQRREARACKTKKDIYLFKNGGVGMGLWAKFDVFWVKFAKRFAEDARNFLKKQATNSRYTLGN